MLNGAQIHLCMNGNESLAAAARRTALETEHRGRLLPIPLCCSALSLLYPSILPCLSNMSDYGAELLRRQLNGKDFNEKSEFDVLNFIVFSFYVQARLSFRTPQSE